MHYENLIAEVFDLMVKLSDVKGGGGEEIRPLLPLSAFLFFCQASKIFFGNIYYVVPQEEKESKKRDFFFFD